MSPTDPAAWTAFAARARTDGKLIEKVIKDVYTRCLSPDANALDGGANVGFHTIGLAERLVRGRVLAVEANQATFANLQKNTRRFPQVSPLYAALQSDPAREHITFNCSPSHPGRSGVSRLWDRIAPGQVSYDVPVEVPATTIDRLIQEQELTHLEFVKLDLEGGEYHALQGAADSLRRLRPLVVSEHSVHAPKLNGFEIGSYLDWLAAIGYVPMAPNGQLATHEAPFPFWYVFLVPSERLDAWRSDIATSLAPHL